jgi:RNA polymerase subunit RPABC4/transcription elongation factor Spt4
MFCSKCGENLAEGTIFCPKCGNKVTGVISDIIDSVAAHSNDTNAEEKKVKSFRYGIMGFALLLCIFFFTLPLVQCSRNTSLTATGIEIATGTGDLFGRDDSGFPLAFILVFIPVTLLILTFTNKSFAALNFVSIAGLAAKIIFMIFAFILISDEYGEYGGSFKLTGSNWFILFIYIGLCVTTFYCKKTFLTTKSVGDYVQRNVNDKKCKQCNKTFPGTYTGCPHCGSSLYEELNQNTLSMSMKTDNGYSVRKIEESNEKKRCQTCGTSVPFDTYKCPRCGNTSFSQ